MSYIALARKWRPRKFSEVVGQEYITRALQNSIVSDKTHHAYIFTGSAGVGKTTIARIFAKALNCQVLADGEPCLQCESCVAIDQGKYSDLLEIDGASRTKVEDIRTLLDNVIYAPMHGRFKIYLIDEVHMLSTHSFNALLKTLEEPPAHIKFLLATTEPQKIPVTVLSRCLQLNLLALSDEDIVSHLEHILQVEEVQYETAALHFLAKLAAGSLRDSLSLLDKALASLSGTLTTAHLKKMMHLPLKNYSAILLKALLDNNMQEILNISKHISKESSNFTYVMQEFLALLHNYSLALCVPNFAATLNDASLLEWLNLADLQLFYNIGIKGLEEISLAPSAAIGFEMVFLRMYAFKPKDAIISPQHAFLAESCVVSTEKYVETVDWPGIVAKLGLTGLALSAVNNSKLKSFCDNIVSLEVEHKHKVLFTESSIAKIKISLQEIYSNDVSLVIEYVSVAEGTPLQHHNVILQQKIHKAEEVLALDSTYQSITKRFATQIVDNSTEFLHNE
jgi:DNA polymerase III subunit gamma/tau